MTRALVSPSAHRSLGDLLDHVDPTQPDDWWLHLRRLVWPILASAGLLVTWAFLAPISGAVVAAAQLKVEHKRKTVQHLEGGIVQALFVQDGQQVRAGDALLVVGDMRSQAELGVLREQWFGARARAARAEAQTRLAERLDVPADLQQDAAEHVDRERALFVAQRQAYLQQASRLADQTREVQAEVVALQSQIDAAGESADLAKQELALNEDLARQGFVSRAKLLGLQRTHSDYRGRIGELHGNLSAARQRLADAQARLTQLRVSAQAQAADELNEASARVRELEQHLQSSSDAFERQTVRAPVDGEVMGLRVSAVGAVVAPREPLLEVVPSGERLVVQAQIAPADIEHVHVGTPAEVRLVGGDRRGALPVPATVSFVSADSVRQAETGQVWFDVAVEMDAQALKAQHGSLPLRSGMPVELYVNTGDRTLLEYLARPLGLFTRRALREP